MNQAVIAMSAAVVLLTGRAQAQTRLAVGDPAPPLQVAHWMKGAEVTDFEPGRIYIIEFWATWCAPCVASMEHLSEVQERYGNRDVRVLGVSDEPLQKTVAFLFMKAKNEDRLQNDRTRYSLATDPDRSTLEDYLHAAMINAIPATFIVGRTGKIEWIGHPNDLDPVIEAVVADTWDLAAERKKSLRSLESSREIGEASDALSAAVEAEDWTAAIDAVDRLIRLKPDSYYSTTRLAILLSKAHEYEIGYRYAREVMKQSWESDPLRLYQMAWTISGNDRYPIPDEHRDLNLAAKLATRAVELAPDDSEFLRMLAHIHAQRGAFGEAAETQRRAIDALEALRATITAGYVAEFETDLIAMREVLGAYEGGRLP